jgi:hypothetical protein
MILIIKYQLSSLHNIIYEGYRLIVGELLLLKC